MKRITIIFLPAWSTAGFVMFGLQSHRVLDSNKSIIASGLTNRVIERRLMIPHCFVSALKPMTAYSLADRYFSCELIRKRNVKSFDLTYKSHRLPPAPRGNAIFKVRLFYRVEMVSRYNVVGQRGTIFEAATLHKRLAARGLSRAKLFFSTATHERRARHLGVTYCHGETGVTCQDKVLKRRRGSATSSRLIVRLARLACCRAALYGPPTLCKPGKGRGKRVQ